MLLNRTVVVPESVTLLMPMIFTVPVASSASVPLPSLTRPTVAFSSNRPVAVGFNSLADNRAGP